MFKIYRRLRSSDSSVENEQSGNIFWSMTHEWYYIENVNGTLMTHEWYYIENLNPGTLMTHEWYYIEKGNPGTPMLLHNKWFILCPGTRMTKCDWSLCGWKGGYVIVQWIEKVRTGCQCVWTIIDSHAAYTAAAISFFRRPWILTRATSAHCSLYSGAAFETAASSRSSRSRLVQSISHRHGKRQKSHPPAGAVCQSHGNGWSSGGHPSNDFRQWSHRYPNVRYQLGCSGCVKQFVRQPKGPCRSETLGYCLASCNNKSHSGSL